MNLLRTLAILLFVLVASATASRAGEAKPNFVFFLVDDLGWADLGVNGSKFHETPNINALAKSGMQFTQGYAACPVCSPTRASIMTGRHPVRVDITDWIPGMNSARYRNPKFKQVEDRSSLALSETTIAELLKSNGYSTFFAGKWHLGDKGSLPTDHGFDINVGGFRVGSPPGGYYAPWTNPYLKAKKEGEYLTERLTQESIDFLENRDASNPFLLYLAYYNVHTPIQPYRKRVEHFRQKAKSEFPDPTPAKQERQGVSRTRQDNADYASMIAAVDESVGRILATLDELKLSDNTVVMFFSDNGGLCTLAKPGPTSNLPLRSGKGWLYEGGIREPMFIRAPGVTKPGSVCEQPVISTDFFPTILQLAGIRQRPELHADGVSLVPCLQGKPAEHQPLYWYYPHYHGSLWTPGAAIRDGDWKLIEFYEFGDFELYNLANDIGEQVNLAKQEPEKAKQLRDKLTSWLAKLDATKLEPNPNYDPKQPTGGFRARNPPKRKP